MVGVVRLKLPAVLGTSGAQVLTAPIILASSAREQALLELWHLTECFYHLKTPSCVKPKRDIQGWRSCSVLRTPYSYNKTLNTARNQSASPQRLGCPWQARPLWEVGAARSFCPEAIIQGSATLWNGASCFSRPFSQIQAVAAV